MKLVQNSIGGNSKVMSAESNSESLDFDTDEEDSTTNSYDKAKARYIQIN